MMRKSIRSPFSFSMICGWLVEMRMLRAPRPSILHDSPRLKRLRQLYFGRERVIAKSSLCQMYFRAGWGRKTVMLDGNSGYRYARRRVCTQRFLRHCTLALCPVRRVGGTMVLAAVPVWRRLCAIPSTRSITFRTGAEMEKRVGVLPRTSRTSMLTNRFSLGDEPCSYSGALERRPADHGALIDPQAHPCAMPASSPSRRRHDGALVLVAQNVRGVFAPHRRTGSPLRGWRCCRIGADVLRLESSTA